MTKVIINGGKPLEGCPKSWEEANEWQTKANEKIENTHCEPSWQFDCGFKLDFDGPILSISSRFYPPKSHYGEKWDGNITVFLLTKEIKSIAIEADSLDELKVIAESEVKKLEERIEQLDLDFL